MTQQRYMHLMAIVHGQSEYRIASSLKSNLRLKHAIIGRKKGKSSIQVTNIMDILHDTRFRSFHNFIREFPDVKHKKNKLIDFLLFIIMDLDDCTAAQRAKYVKKELFLGHWLYEYIVAIYNDPNLEATMQEAQIDITYKKDYLQIFPTNHGDLDLDKAHELYLKLKKCQCSNMHLYVKHCLKIAFNSLSKF